MSFTGFPSAGLTLLTRLPGLDPAGFAAERTGWDTLLLEPARRFATDLGAVLAERISPGLIADPRVNRVDRADQPRPAVQPTRPPVQGPPAVPLVGRQRP